MSLLQNLRRIDIPGHEFDYQPECHCSKTRLCISGPVAGLTTSQNVTAPKRAYQLVTGIDGLTTSQNVTAPKLGWFLTVRRISLTTSQNVTAPKLELSPMEFYRV